MELYYENTKDIFSFDNFFRKRPFYGGTLENVLCQRGRSHSAGAFKPAQELCAQGIFISQKFEPTAAQEINFTPVYPQASRGAGSKEIGDP